MSAAHMTSQARGGVSAVNVCLIGYMKWFKQVWVKHCTLSGAQPFLYSCLLALVLHELQSNMQSTRRLYKTLMEIMIK